MRGIVEKVPHSPSQKWELRIPLSRLEVQYLERALAQTPNAPLMYEWARITLLREAERRLAEPEDGVKGA